MPPPAEPRSRLRPWPSLTAGLLALWLTVPSPADDKPIDDKPVGANPAGNGNLSRSISIVRDRAAEQQFTLAREKLRQRQFADAVALAQELLEEPPQGMLADGERLLSRTAAAHEILAAIRQQSPDTYRRYTEATARQQLQTARSQMSRDGLLNVVRNYPFTQAGRTALLELLLLAVDIGNQDEAARLGTLARRHWPDDARALAAIDRWLQATADQRPASPDSPPDPPGIEQLPSAVADWQVETGISPEAADVIADLLAELDAHGILPAARFRPLAVGGHGIFRTWNAVIAIDAKSGKETWRVPLDSTVSRLVRRAGDLTSRIRRTQVLPILIRRLLGDTLYNRITTDGARIYALEPVVAADNAAEVRSAEDDDATVFQNQLTALNATDGQLAWTRSTLPLSVEEDAEPEELPVYFLGPPLGAGETLYGIAEYEGTFQAFALDAISGAPQWIVKIGASTVPFREDYIRHATACTPVLSGNVLICPTGAGALVAVDLLHHEVRWVFRYPRDDVPPGRHDIQLLQQQSAELYAMAGWRTGSLHAAAGHVVLASPEVGRLFVLDSETGTPTWSLPRGNAAWIAGIDNGRLVVVQSDGIAGYSIEDGRVLWQAETPRPVGPGVLLGGACVIPVADGRVSAVRLSDGQITSTSPRIPPSRVFSDQKLSAHPVESAGSLLTVDGRWMLQKVEGITGHVPVADRLASAPDATQAEAARVADLLEAGLFADAIELAEAQTNEGQPDRAVLLAALKSAVRFDSDHRPQWINRWRELANSGEELLQSELARFDDAVDRHAVVEAFETGFRLLRQESVPLPMFEATGRSGDGRLLLQPRAESWYVRDAQQRTLTRLDRYVAGQLLNLSPDTNPEQFDRQLQSRLEAVRQKEPWTLARTIAQAFVSQSAGQQMLLDLEPRWTGIEDFALSELTLLGQAELKASPLAGQTLKSVAAFYGERNDWSQAAESYRRLGRLFPEMPLFAGQTASQFLEDGAAPALQNALKAPDPWPVHPPRISERNWPAGNVYFVPVDVKGDLGHPLDRLNVSVDRMGQVVRFSGAGFRRPWAVDLPRSNQPWRADPELRRGWARGHLLVLQVGSELFGIAPFDANGEPYARIVWPEPGQSIDTRNEGSLLLHTYAAVHRPRLVGVRAPSTERVDPFGRRLGDVGPIHYGYLCHRHQGHLVVRATWSGKVLWRQFDVPASVRCFGDEEHVVLLDTSSGRMQVLRALDGTLLEERQWTADPKGILFADRGRVLVQSPPPSETGTLPPGATELTLTLHDLVTGRPIWTRTAPVDAIPFLIDSQWFGVLEQSGETDLIDLPSGEVRASTRLELPKELDNIFTLHDADRFYVMASALVEDRRLLTAAQIQRGFRRPTVNGFLHAFDRRTATHQWTKQLENLVLPLDQPRDVPLLISNDSLNLHGDERSGAPTGRLQCFDKQTGELVWETMGTMPQLYFMIERDETSGWVELRMSRTIVRFDFSPPPPAKDQAD
ncbi:PQQ-binding-like beta-propeller repeat protein [Maioricimonas sp. JC845]|uniref:outer membrane protein assembly factor BamB family protein n=1 Tax=Maioricimonas sp. JC845 TaxID=3232138 RepID=UPI00345777DC